VTKQKVSLHSYQFAEDETVTLGVGEGVGSGVSDGTGHCPLSVIDTLEPTTEPSQAQNVTTDRGGISIFCGLSKQSTYET
jgi:hypothetical protein